MEQVTCPIKEGKWLLLIPPKILYMTKLIWSVAAFSLPVCMEEKCVVDIQVHCFQFISDLGNLDQPHC